MYTKAEDRSGKPTIILSIISEVYAAGGRFMRNDLKHRNQVRGNIVFI